MTPTFQAVCRYGGRPLSLVEALADAGIGECALWLHGRNQVFLEMVQRYGRHRLGGAGWKVEACTDLDQALEGSDVVIQQIRFGGLAGRGEDEAINHQLGLPADETLGAGALHRILRSGEAIRSLGSRIASQAPKSWVLNLTNPLSGTTRLLQQGGVNRCLGVCELPRETADALAGLLGSPAGFNWDYAGLNHRGFITNLQVDGEDALPMVLSRLQGAAVTGINRSDINALRVIPTRYFKLYSAPAATKDLGRAEFLEQLREQIMSELVEYPDSLPLSLGTRKTPWYPLGVIPLLRSILGERPERHVVNLRSPDGVVEEGFAWISRKGISPCPRPQLPRPAQRWWQSFRRHEEAVAAAVDQPTHRAIRIALELDPLVPGSCVSEALTLVTRSTHRSPEPSMRSV